MSAQDKKTSDKITRVFSLATRYIIIFCFFIVLAFGIKWLLDNDFLLASLLLIILVLIFGIRIFFWQWHRYKGIPEEGLHINLMLLAEKNGWGWKYNTQGMDIFDLDQSFGQISGFFLGRGFLIGTEFLDWEPSEIWWIKSVKIELSINRTLLDDVHLIPRYKWWIPLIFRKIPLPRRYHPVEVPVGNPEFDGKYMVRVKKPGFAPNFLTSRIQTILVKEVIPIEFSKNKITTWVHHTTEANKIIHYLNLLSEIAEEIGDKTRNRNPTT